MKIVHRLAILFVLWLVVSDIWHVYSNFSEYLEINIIEHTIFWFFCSAALLVFIIGHLQAKSGSSRLCLLATFQLFVATAISGVLAFLYRLGLKSHNFSRTDYNLEYNYVLDPIFIVIFVGYLGVLIWTIKCNKRKA